MKMTDAQLKMVLSDGLGLTPDDEEMLERSLYKIDRIDRRQKVKRKGLIEKIFVKKYTFRPELADTKYREFAEKVYKNMAYKFFKSPEGQEVDELFDKMNRDNGYLTGEKCGAIIFQWKQKNMKRIVNDTIKEMKRA